MKRRMQKLHSKEILFVTNTRKLLNYVFLCLIILFIGFSYINHNSNQEVISLSPGEEPIFSPDFKTDFSFIWVIVILIIGILISIVISSIRDLYFMDVERKLNYNK